MLDSESFCTDVQVLMSHSDNNTPNDGVNAQLKQFASKMYPSNRNKSLFYLTIIKRFFKTFTSFVFAL